MSDQPQHRSSGGSKQEELFEECIKREYRAPVYQHVSDRRGGRTAWSAVVDVNGKMFQARFWYDGQYIDNAREDVAEVVLTYIKSSPGILSDESQARERADAKGGRARRPEGPDQAELDHFANR